MKLKVKTKIIGRLQRKIKRAINFIDSVIFELKEHRDKEKLDDYLKNTTNRPKYIGVILDKGMGDFLLFAYYLTEMISYYEKQGKKVYIICTNYNVEFLKFLKIKIRNIIIIKQEGSRLINAEFIEQYGNLFEKIIIPRTRISKEICCLIRQLNSTQVYSVGKEIGVLPHLSFSDLRYINSIICFPGVNEGFYAVRHKKFMEQLTHQAQKLALINIDIRKPIIDDLYYIINIGASSHSMVWPIENVIELINLLNKKVYLKPIVVGNANQQQIWMMRKNNISVDYVNIFDIEKMISICSYAKFMVTNDTGQYHLSVCLGVKTFVVNGGLGQLFMPYPKELMKEKIVYMTSKSKCEDCRSNLQCYFKRKNAITVKCIERLKAEDVYTCLESDGITKKYSMTNISMGEVR